MILRTFRIDDCSQVTDANALQVPVVRDEPVENDYPDHVLQHVLDALVRIVAQQAVATHPVLLTTKTAVIY